MSNEVSKTMVHHVIVKLLDEGPCEITCSFLSEQLGIPLHLAQRYLTSYIEETNPPPQYTLVLEVHRHPSLPTEDDAFQSTPLAEFLLITPENMDEELRKIQTKGQQVVVSLGIFSIWNTKRLDPICLWNSEIALGFDRNTEDTPSQIPFHVVHRMSKDGKLSVRGEGEKQLTTLCDPRIVSDPNTTQLSKKPKPDAPLKKKEQQKEGSFCSFYAQQEIQQDTLLEPLSQHDHCGQITMPNLSNSSAEKMSPTKHFPSSWKRECIKQPVETSKKEGKHLLKKSIKKSMIPSPVIQSPLEVMEENSLIKKQKVESLETPLALSTQTCSTEASHASVASKSLWNDTDSSSDASYSDEKEKLHTADIVSTNSQEKSCSINHDTSAPETYTTRVKVNVEKRSTLGKYTVIETVEEAQDIVMERRRGISTTPSLKEESAPKKQRNLHSFFQKIG